MAGIIKSYFEPYKDYFWQFEEAGSVVAVPNGKTICYTSHLKEIIEQFKPNRLPPFGALLLAYFALGSEGKENIFQLRNWIKQSSLASDTEILEAIPMLEILQSASTKLNRDQYGFLLKCLFENCHNQTSIQKSQSVYKNLGNQQFDLEAKSPIYTAKIRYDFRALAIQKRKFQNSEQLLEALHRIPEQPDQLNLDFEKNPNLDKKSEELSLPEQLIQHPKTTRIGKLVKNIWSGLNIPFHSTVPSNQPLGGVSDLTNKGNFDQLLISEFANSDLVFLSRLANNEALFLSRETPPADNDMKRTILIDISLKAWGNPKLIAFSTLVAIAHHPKSEIECEAYVVGSKSTKINFDSVSNIIEALTHTDVALHPAQGLKNHMVQFPKEKNVEIIVITEHSTGREEEMIEFMNSHRTEIQYWINTDAEGNIDVHKNYSKSKKHVCHLKLPLKKLWSENSKKAPEKKQKDFPQKKESFEQTYVPLKVPKPSLSYEASFGSSQIRLLLTKTKSLLKWNGDSRSAYQVLIPRINLPGMKMITGKKSNLDYMVLIISQGVQTLLLINLTQGWQQKIDFDFKTYGKTPVFLFDNDHFKVKSKLKGWKILDNGNIQIDDELAQSRRAYRNKYSEVDPSYGYYNSFKRLKHVAISEEGQLSLNRHQLRYKHLNGFWFDTNLSKKFTKVAQRTGKNKFSFADGTSVELFPVGYLILTSSNQNLAPIYISTILETQIGLASAQVFTGNEFYKNGHSFQVKIESAGPHKLALIKTLKYEFNYDFREAREIIDSVPIHLEDSFSEQTANELKESLEHAGATIELSELPSEHGKLEDIDASEFLESYLQPAFDQIC